MPAPRVVDASRPTLRVDVEVSEAAELLMSLSTIVSNHRPEDFDLGVERIEQVRSKAPADLIELASGLFTGDGTAAQLLGLVNETPAPRSVADFVAFVEAVDPLEFQLTLLGYYARGHHIAQPETIRRAALGDADAASELVAAAGQWQTKCVMIERVLEHGGARIKEQLVEIVSRWNSEVFEPTLAEIRPLLERDAAEKRALAGSVTPAEFVEQATGGIQYIAPPEIHALVFFPTYWFKPWVMMSEHKNARIFAYGIGSGAPAQSEDVDLSEVARLYKALADEKRLTLLRLLDRGPVALGVAAKEVGLSKSTTHHHLAILRQAGLVLIREDEENSYTLRPERLREAGPLLARLTSGSVTRST